MTSGDINIILAREILLSESESRRKSFAYNSAWFWIVSNSAQTVAARSGYYEHECKIFHEQC